MTSSTSRHGLLQRSLLKLGAVGAGAGAVGAARRNAPARGPGCELHGSTAVPDVQLSSSWFVHTALIPGVVCPTTSSSGIAT